MSSRRTFTHKFTVQAPLARVAEFHSDTRALKLLTPPPIFVQFHDVQPLGEGSRADFTMWIGPVPVRWVAVHSNFQVDRGFVDTQESGPFEFWQHRHTFRTISENRTEIIDEVQAETGAHPFWGIVSRIMWLNLPIMFAYRAWITRRQVERTGVQNTRVEA